MKDLLLPLLHLAVTAAKLCRPGGVRAVIAENLLLKQQLDRATPFAPACAEPQSGRSAPMRIRGACSESGTDSQGRHRTAPVHVADLPSGAGARQVPPIVFLKRATEEAGPKGAERVAHPRHRRAQIAQSSIRVPADCAHHLADVRGRHRTRTSCTACWRNRYRPAPGGTGPSWLSFVGHTTDSLWSVDLLRCASIVLQSDWVLVVMDQFTRRLVGFGVHRGPVDAPSLCRMCNAAIHGRGAPRHLSTDHDPLFEAHRWTANLRLLEIDEIKTVPHVPLSHPFVERLIGTMRRECLDHVLCWNAGDLERKLADFQASYNAARSHASWGLHAVRLRGRTHGGPCRIQTCALDLPLPGHGPASSGGLMTNSRPTRECRLIGYAE